MPYVRGAGRWPHGEEWLLEAMAECYVPLLEMLRRLERDAVPYRLCMSLTPVLLEQLADPRVQVNFLEYTLQRAEAAEQDARRFDRDGENHLARLARAYADEYRAVRTSFQDSYERDLVSAFSSLRRAGQLELITSAATHAYLALLQQEGSIRLQLRTAVDAHQRHLGGRPRVIWLPECAYRPGLEALLAEQGIDLFFTDVHLLQGGPPRGTAADDLVGPYDWSQPLEDQEASRPNRRESVTTLRPYWVGASEVAAVSRNARTGEQVWSATVGYPGDPWYREFHKRDQHSGLQYWRVTGGELDLGAKRTYRPDKARERLLEHADHFSGLVIQELQKHRNQSDAPGLLAACYDTELFGHWWAEGIDWLEAVLRRVAQDTRIEFRAPSDYIEVHPPRRAIELHEGSWGAGGGHAVWLNDQTQWMWDEVHAAERRFAGLLDSDWATSAEQSGVLAQTARELLLLQSSDWPFLVTTGQAPEYAEKRLKAHAERFSALAGALEAQRPASDRAEELLRIDRVFPTLRPGWFAPDADPGRGSDS